MRRLVTSVVAGLVLVPLAACGASGSGDGTSGIRGRALAGPQCPVEVAGSPCPAVAWEGTVVAIDAESGDEFTVETDAEGRFEIALEPGRYEVTIASDSQPPFAKPQAVRVEPGAFTSVTVAVDTGIR
jgi:hypothetical protein